MQLWEARWLLCQFEHVSSFAAGPYVCMSISQSPSPKMAVTPEETGIGMSGARTPVAGGTGRRETTPSLATVQVQGIRIGTLINAHQVY